MIPEVLGYSHLMLYGNSVAYPLMDHFNLEFNLQDVDIKHREVLIKVYFLLDPAVQDLLRMSIDYLMNMSITTKKYTTVNYANVNASIDWNDTIKARLQKGGLNNPIYICKPNRKDFNRAENLVMKYLLLNIRDIIISFLSIDKNSEFDTEEIKEINDKSWKGILKENLNSINTVLFNHQFKNVTSLKVINNHHIKQLELSKNKYSNLILKVYNLYSNLFITQNEQVQKNVLLKKALVNCDDDKLFELYCLIKLYRFLDSISIEKKYRVAGYTKTEECVAEYRFETGIMEIRFQTLPSRVKNSSKYMCTCKAALQTKQIHRAPDIFLTWIENDSSNYIDTFIEVKHSNNKEYFRDSIYKIFGYLYDFGNVLNFSPKGILVFDSGIKVVKEDEYWIIDTDNFETYLEELLITFGVYT